MGQQAAPTHPILCEPLVSSRGGGHVFSVKMPCLRKHTLVGGFNGTGSLYQTEPSVLTPLTSGKACDPEQLSEVTPSAVATVRTDRDSCQEQVGTEEVDAPC